MGRENFTTSRLSEFTSVKELTTATGHPSDQWPLVVLKELTDNGIDAAEKAGAPPVITIVVAGNNITVTDNGPGIDAETIVKITDFSTRTSSNEAYVSPTRGQQGNALQTILAMAFALDGERGETVIESRGIKHTMAFEIDPIRREPKPTHTQTRSPVKNGTRITVQWPVCASTQLQATKPRFVQIAEDYATLNPHLSITLGWDGHKEANVTAADQEWPKWLPDHLTSAHWYSIGRFNTLISANIAKDQDNGRDTLVREFISKTFPGMSRSASQKTVLDQIGASRMSLAGLFAEGKNQKVVATLLRVLQAVTKRTKPADLGLIGRDHLEARCVAAGADTGILECGYHKILGTTDGLPWTVEVAFGYCPNAEKARLIAGCNWSPAVSDPFRDLDAVLVQQRVISEGPNFSPVVVIVHLSCPALSFTDRGKSTLALPHAITTAVHSAVIKVTEKWAKLIKSEERDSSAQSRREDRMMRSGKITVKDAANEVMEQAWLTASSDGTLPASARQVMYAARPAIQAATGKQLDDQYFTQTLLPNYMAENDVDWNVTFDNRGQFIEPHTNRVVGLGTLAVRRYLQGIGEPIVDDATLQDARVLTSGPIGNFGAVLFIEKEGFTPLLQQVQLAERFDIAIMSTKGMSVLAARRLIERLCGDKGIPLFVLHDFDKAGLSIASTLARNTRRYQFEETIKIVDLGLRLDDVEALGLEASAEATFDKGSDDARRDNLDLNGASEAEIDFLLSRRVELNALTSGQFVDFVERKLLNHGVEKVLPNLALLKDAYQAGVRGERIRAEVHATLAEANTHALIPAPVAIKAKVEAYLKENPASRWDDAVAQIARDHYS
jgi:DNA topoisomerase VI subunit B